MSNWQRPVRICLAAFSITFAVAVITGIRDRPEPIGPGDVERTDNDAVVESRGARILQTEATLENLKVVANRQLAYPDGSVKLVGDVRIETADHLVAITGEASYSDNESLVTMPTPTEFVRGGLVARGDSARYDRQHDVVYLEPNAFVELHNNDPGRNTDTSIVAESAIVAQRDGYMQFNGGATVDVGENHMSGEKISMTLNTLDKSRIDSIEIIDNAHILRRETRSRESQQMSASRIVVTYDDDSIKDAELTGDASISGNGQSQQMSAPRIAVAYGKDSLEKVELTGGALIIAGKSSTPGHIRNMSAPEINVAYETESPEAMTLRDGANIELFGNGIGDGATISSLLMEVRFAEIDNSFDNIKANDDVVVNMPRNTGIAQRIESSSLEIVSQSTAVTDQDEALLEATFDGNVRYRELRVAEDGHALSERVVLAHKLQATLEPGLTTLRLATFNWNVELSSGDITGKADAAVYDADEDTFTFLTLGLAGPLITARHPVVDDRRGSMQAETITVHFEGPYLEATGGIESVLDSSRSSSEDAAELDVLRRPRLLTEGAPIYVVSDEFTYDSELSQATYSGAARLWQDDTEFKGATLVLDEVTGNVTAEGAVQTKTKIIQNDRDSGEKIETTTTASGASFIYDDEARLAFYSGNAALSANTFTLSGSEIEVILHDDARTLDQIVALGNVQLELDAGSGSAQNPDDSSYSGESHGRWVVGDGLTYFDADGRYEVTGRPVRIIEEIEREEIAGEIVEECRETTGRAITFYLTAEAISVDGQSEVRTSTTNGDCTTLRPF